jgi:AraC family transcriptional regulator
MEHSRRWRPEDHSRFYYWDGGFLAIGRAHGILAKHSHHGYQLVIAVDDPVSISIDDGPWEQYRVAVILPNAPHAYNPNGNIAAALLVDPDSYAGRALRRSYQLPITRLPDDIAAGAQEALRSFWESGSQGSAPEFIRDMVNRFCRDEAPARKLDDRVARAIAMVRTLEPCAVGIKDVAAHLHLSPGRFSHLFTADVGLSFGRYLLWRRLSRAMVVVARGESLSAAAHAAGFADAAHFSRTFAQMLGIAPSQFLNQGYVYEIAPPFEDAT